MAERVNVDKIDKLKNQRIKKNDTVDSIAIAICHTRSLVLR